jgi:CHAT domain
VKAAVKAGAIKRSAPAVPTQEARLEIEPATITLRVEPDPDGIEAVRPVEVEARTPQIDQDRWAGDAAASYAQAQGRILWAHVFSGALGLALSHAASSADAAGQGLTVRVVPGQDIPTDRLWLPWELLVDPAQGNFLALTAGRSIVRGAATNEPTRPLPAGRPLRLTVVNVLYLDGAPDDWRTAFHHAADEAAWLSGLAADGTGRLEVGVVNDPDQAGLLDLLRTTDADVLHVIGTGVAGGMAVRDPDAADPFPYLGAVGMRNVAAPSVAHRLDAGAMGAALAQNPGVGLVVLNGCDLGETAEVVNLMTGATVLAHRGGVSDVHAAWLTEAFYPPLVEGMPLDLAVSEARRRLELHFPGQVPWASTVLFTGWPPARFAPPAQAVDPANVSFDGPSVEPAPQAASAADLVRLMHQTNLARLQTLPHQEWAPIAAQVTTATSPGAAP